MTRTLMRIGCCLLAPMLLIATAAAQEPVAGNQKMQRYALLIAVDEYAPPLGALEYCHNDMTSLKAHLEASGFAPDDIIFMHDQAELSRFRPTKANIEGELRLRLQLANPDDVVVVAFSGHGLHLDGKSYLCPIDTKLDAESSMVAIDDVYAQLQQCAASQKLLIVDACRNEPIVRGFKSGKLADDLTVQLEAPPKGVLVLSSCEAGQFSAEDAELKHGVFMHFLMEGLKGAADLSDNGGNGNGRISLDELYFFAHERTKRHVALSHGIVQRPVMKGEIVGRFDLAMVPDSTRLRDLAAREQAQQAALVNTVRPADSPTVKSLDDPLLRQADTYLRQADYENAILAYTAIIDDTAIDVELRREARKSRGAAYLARGGKNDINKALIDQQAAGLPGVRLTVRAPTADLKVSNSVSGRVRQNQSVLVTMVQGEWLWVAAVDGSDKVQGYLQASAVRAQPVEPVAEPVVQNRPQQQQQYNYNNQQNTRTPYNNRQQTQNNRQGRPPSIWQTPEWERPRDIQRLRQQGRIR